MVPIIQQAVREAHQPRIEYFHRRLGDIVVSSQFSEGASLWAKWVRDGRLAHYHVVWVFRVLKDGKRQWLYISLDRGLGKGIIFDLTTQEGKRGLRELEQRMPGIFARRERKGASAARLDEFDSDGIHLC